MIMIKLESKTVGLCVAFRFMKQGILVLTLCSVQSGEDHPAFRPQHTAQAPRIPFQERQLWIPLRSRGHLRNMLLTREDGWRSWSQQ